jgi:hypothetical protein
MESDSLHITFTIFAKIKNGTPPLFASPVLSEPQGPRTSQSEITQAYAVSLPVSVGVRERVREGSSRPSGNRRRGVTALGAEGGGCASVIGSFGAGGIDWIVVGKPWDIAYSLLLVNRYVLHRPCDFYARVGRGNLMFGNLAQRMT